MRNPINTLLGIKVSIELSSTARKKESHSFYPLFFFSTKSVPRSRKKTSSRRSWVYETSNDIDLILQLFESKI